LHIWLEQVDGRLQLAVADNGPGLSPAARQHVFDRFWRGESSRSRDQGGSGLGLAICRAIVEAHHGRIWAEETPGGGATFILELSIQTAD
jgi:signal transduction histidine kinase